MYDISELKVGDIMICDCGNYRQLFYVHNIINGTLEMSGVSENCNLTIFNKMIGWSVDRIATEAEVSLFYELIQQYGFKFNLNTGISRC